jgi:hypothetical protein
VPGNAECPVESNMNPAGYLRNAFSDDVTSDHETLDLKW